MRLCGEPSRNLAASAAVRRIDAATPKNLCALCAYLSGGGSTIAAFAIDGEERIARAMMQEAIARGYPGRTAITTASDAGATVISSA